MVDGLLKTFDKTFGVSSLGTPFGSYTDYLSDLTGFCHYVFDLEEVEE